MWRLLFFLRIPTYPILATTCGIKETRIMKFTVRTLFNPAAFGLEGPHYAVVADLPADLAGKKAGPHVVDVLPASEYKSAQDIKEEFEDCARFMPYTVDELGVQVQFLTRAQNGHVKAQCKGYFPHKAQTGATPLDTYLEYMSFRARVGLWAESRNRVVLSAEDQARVLSGDKPSPGQPDSSVRIKLPAGLFLTQKLSVV